MVFAAVEEGIDVSRRRQLLVAGTAPSMFYVR